MTIFPIKKSCSILSVSNVFVFCFVLKTKFWSLKFFFKGQKIHMSKLDEKHKLGSKANFLVKVQVSLREHEAYYKWKTERSARGNRPEKHGLTLYNQDRSIMGCVLPSEENYDDLFEAGLSSVSIIKKVRVYS